MVNKWKEIEAIKGWFLVKAAALFIHADKIQKAADIKGDIMEIGTYHGKSACLLGQCLRPEEKFYAVDTFNGYTGGESFRHVFEKYYQDIVGRPVDTIYPDKSSDLINQGLKQEYRIWHIDGYHSFEETLNDMVLGNMYMIDKGLMIIDDFLNQDWLGVNQAVNEFLRTNVDEDGNPTWAIVAYGYNKTFLVRVHHYAFYKEQFAKSEFDRSPHNFLPFHGHKYVSFK